MTTEHFERLRDYIAAFGFAVFWAAACAACASAIIVGLIYAVSLFVR